MEDFDIYFPGIVVKSTYGPGEHARSATAFTIILEVLMQPMVSKTITGGFIIGTHSFIGAN